jgi:hypothetical protein
VGRKHVGEHEPAPFDDLTRGDRDRRLEHRSVERERVKLATLAAGSAATTASRTV